MNMARSNSSEPRAGSELRAGAARPGGARSGNGADAGVAGGPSGYGAGTDVASAPASNAAGAKGSVLNGGLASDGTKSRSDWQLAKKISFTMLRHPKSGFLSLWIYFWVPLMIFLQDYEEKDFSTWLLIFSLMIVVGIAPGFMVWEVERLRTLSLPKRVIRLSRLTVSSLHGLAVYFLAFGLLGWKIGLARNGFWIVMVVAASLQVGLQVQQWKDAGKISDSLTREKRWREAAKENAKNKAEQSKDTAAGASIGIQGRVGRKLSSGDRLLDEITLKPSVSYSKWFVLPFVLLAFVAMVLNYAVDPTPNNIVTWALWAVLTITMTSPFWQSLRYNRQVISWLSFSGTRPQWWHQHLRATIHGLWQGPLLIMVLLGGYSLGLMLRGAEPIIPFNLGTSIAGVCLGLGFQFALTGLTNALLIVINRLKGWKVAATAFGLYFAFTVFVISVTANTIDWVDRKDALGEGVGKNQPINIQQLAWHFMGPTMLGLVLAGAILWGFSVWGYRRLNVGASEDRDIFGTSK